MSQQPVNIGEPAPWFSATDGEDRRPVAFDELAGSFILLCFFKTAAADGMAAALASLGAQGDLFEGGRALFLGVTSDPDDFTQRRLPQRAGHRYLLDANGGAGARYGAGRPKAFLLSPALQILAIMDFDKGDASVAHAIRLLGAALAAPAPGMGAPVLFVPQVFDQALCRRLIDLYESDGGREIGLIENKGQVIERTDTAFRKRLDYYISDSGALQTCREMLERRLLPLVYRAFQFPTTRIERYLVGCYDATTGGYFRPHRDNTAPPVAHRRFALTIILNEGYEGGHLRFPEFGNQTFPAAPGGAIVFSCSLLHEVMPVTAGRRYAFITFLYDEQSQKIRDAYAQKHG